ncbi:MAG: glycosyltransferase [Bacillota bacterium]|nr:glycosyltransferase [Bacillota bacterium]
MSGERREKVDGPNSPGKATNASTTTGPQTGSANLTSIIILCYNQVDYTTACVESVLRHTPEPVELVFVDNGSTDGTRSYLDSLLSRTGDATCHPPASITDIKIVRNDRNLGFAGGVNQGIREAAGDFILLLNNDVIVTPGWLGGLHTCALRSTRIGLVGPMSNYVVGPQQVLDPHYDLRKLDEYAMAFARKHAGRLMKVSRVIGFCMLVRREVIDRIGGFDVTFGTGNFEDDDFCLRAIIAGFDVVIAGDVFVHHFGSISFKGARMDYASIMQENAWKFAKKWRIELSAGGYNPLPILARRFDPVSHYFPLVSEWSSKALLAESVRLFEQGRIEASYVAVTKALELEPNNPDAWHNMALIAMTQRDFRLALQAWEKIPQTDMDSERFNLMGMCHFQVGDVDKAVECFRKAIELDADCPGAQENLDIALSSCKSMS